jgi:hypothetical protein
MLFDPGAQKIANAFNCYPKHNVLFHEETENLISYTIEAQFIHRGSQQIIGSGIGAASTLEPKHKYRWVRDPENYGYSQEEIALLKTRTEGQEEDEESVTLYRILNPEYGELVNTIAQIAAKRAEVDGAKSLPGVASALKKLLSGKMKPEEDWNKFWASTRNMSLSPDQVHAMLGVKSVKEWVAQGKSLNDALKQVSEALAKGAAAKKTTPPAPAPNLEPPPTSIDERSGVWANIRAILKRLGKAQPKETSLVKWFTENFQIEVCAKDFEAEVPAEKFTKAILVSYHDTLLQYEAGLPKSK